MDVSKKNKETNSFPLGVPEQSEGQERSSREGAFAEIIIPLALPKNYTWFVPDHLKESVKVGCRVEVKLGKNKKYAGIIKRLHNEKPELFEPKEILNMLDVEPVIY